MSRTPTLSANDAASKRDAVLQRIAAACTIHSRDPAGVQLLAVSKRHSIESIQNLYATGQRAFGENYLQEALEKIPALPSDICWHFIGPIQSNKTRAIAENFDWVHTVSSLRIAQRLNDQRPPNRGALNVCIQVNLEAEAAKSGVDAAEATELAADILQLPHLKLRGLMTIPPPSLDPQRQFAMFDKVAQLRGQLATQGVPLDTLSMGMSSDIEAAIAAGSTIVRVGTALFGPRQ